jgi:hypothetical protein
MTCVLKFLNRPMHTGEELYPSKILSTNETNLWPPRRQGIVMAVVINILLAYLEAEFNSGSKTMLYPRASHKSHSPLALA